MVNFLLNLGYTAWQVVYNLVFLVCHLPAIPKGFSRMKEVRHREFSLPELSQFLREQFTYKKDNPLVDIRPWMINLFIRNLHEDCDGYAAFAKWVVRRQGWDSQFWSLFGSGWGHSVCLFRFGMKKYIADTLGVREFVYFEINFPKAKRFIKRWY